jgi:hypothetical protein
MSAMPDAPQHHRCSWSRRRLTEIALVDGALVGAGAGLATFLFALAADRRYWYAVEIDPDNALFVTLREDAAVPGTEPERPLLPPGLGTQFGIAERHLSDELAARLGLELTAERAPVHPGAVEHVLELHDDCYFRFSSRDPDGIQKALGGILAQHGAHLSRPGLPMAAPEVARLLTSRRDTVRLQSRSADARVDVLARREAGMWRWLRRWTPIGAMVHDGSGWGVRLS